MIDEYTKKQFSYLQTPKAVIKLDDVKNLPPLLSPLAASGCQPADHFVFMQKPIKGTANPD